jgi:alpha-tubulin suppressor-like RCC1 family protein
MALNLSETKALHLYLYTNVITLFVIGTGRCTKREVPSKVIISTTGEIMGGDMSSLKIIDIACGDSHVIAVGDDNSVYGWGLNKRGQLGLGDTDTRHAPTVLPSVLFSKVFAHDNSSAGINVTGDLFTWGSGSRYRLMQMTKGSGAKERQCDASHRLSPSFVDTLEGNIINSFTFSRYASAALVVTRLYELSPQSGPQKSFSELQIKGCGFWDSDSIIVKFSSIQKKNTDSIG